MKSYYNCAAFQSEFHIKQNFSITQDELFLKHINKDGSASFEKKQIEYLCRWKMGENFDSKKPTIIMPTRNMKDLIKKTISNLEKHNITSHCNVIIVDDRSSEDIESVSGNHSYLRVDNNKGFNFSMLNNIPALIAKKLGNTQIVLWNNDLWASSEADFLELLRRHNESGSTVSGSKLLYPLQEISFIKEQDSHNIQSVYPHMSGKWRNTIQYGGTSFATLMPKIQTLTPYHYKRFADPHDPRVNCDRGVSCLTGALMVIQLDDFIKVGGLNPSLSKNYQDTDFCLKIIDCGLSCYYFGKDISFYHDESITLSGSKKNDPQLFNDEILFGKIWNNKIAKLVM